MSKRLEKLQAGHALAKVRLIALLLLGILTLQPVSATSYHASSAPLLSGAFLQYWQTHGGMRQFGAPLTPVYRGGDNYDAQLFERALFTYTPSNPDPYKVQLQLLGSILTENRRDEVPFIPIQADFIFEQTGHLVTRPFLNYWRTTGGLLLYGYPISEEFMEKSPEDGKIYKVQYFERARFELHPEAAGTPLEIQLGLLGAEMLDRMGGTEAIENLAAPQFYTSNNQAQPTATNGVPTAPDLPPTDKQILMQNDFSTDSLVWWESYYVYGSDERKAPVWDVSDGVLRETGLTGRDFPSEETILLPPYWWTSGGIAEYTLDLEYFATSGKPLGVLFLSCNPDLCDRTMYKMQLFGSTSASQPGATLRSFELQTRNVTTLLTESRIWPGYKHARWQRLTIRFSGSNYTFLVDDHEIMRAEIDAAVNPSIYAWADGTAVFDNLRITTP